MRNIRFLALLVLVSCWFGDVLSYKPKPDATNDDKVGDPNAGFLMSDSRRRGRLCAPREIDEDDVMERRRIHKCCRKFGDDYFDFAAERWRHRRRYEDDYDYEEDESPFDRRRKRFWRRQCRRYRIRYEDAQEEERAPSREKTTDDDGGDLPVVTKKSRKPANASDVRSKSKQNDPAVDTEDEEDDDQQSDAPLDEGKVATALGMGKLAGNGTQVAGKGTTASTKGSTMRATTGRGNSVTVKPGSTAKTTTAPTADSGDSDE